MKVMVVASLGEKGRVVQLYHPEKKKMLDTSAYPFGESVRIGNVSAVIDDRGNRFGLVMSVQGIESRRLCKIYPGRMQFPYSLPEPEIWLMPEALIKQIPEFNYGENFWDEAARIHLD